jgi:precorrin-6A/cobalt-precorrin-6A reductase
MSAERLLILGGTGEAAALARAALARFGDRLQVTTSLAGRTQHPGPIPGAVRIGGFGGPEGLARYLREHDVDRLIDATHPFAGRISAEAQIACELAEVPRLMLLRPAWQRHPLDRWIEVSDIPAAAAIVGRLARRVFLTVGHSDIAAFAAVPQVRFLVRLVDPPREPLPLRFHEIILGRGPFSLAAERHLLQRHAIEALVCKASGGAATEAKIIAARDLSLPVVMVRRPPVEAGPRVDSIEAALDWLAGPISAFAARRAR